MRTLTAFLFGALSVGLLSAARQDPFGQDRGSQDRGGGLLGGGQEEGQDGEEEESVLPGSRTPFTSYRLAEQKRISEGIQGVWTLASFDGGVDQLGPGDIQGFAAFVDGHMTLALRSQNDPPEFFFDSTPEYTIQAGAYRYRISPELELQTSTVMGFSNATETGQLDVEVTFEAREYTPLLDGNLLTLTNTVRGVSFTFMRTGGGSEFPQQALDVLEGLDPFGVDDGTADFGGSDY